MGKSLIIGNASNYAYTDLQYWVNSIRKSGFKGDVALTGTNLKKETIERLNDGGIILSLNGKVTENGDVESSARLGQPHVERFFYIWHFLKTRKERYDHVIMTDTRDVVFQSDPVRWLENQTSLVHLVVSSEGMLYKDEPWGFQNLNETFGAFFANDLKENIIYNVGVIAGDHDYVQDLALAIFQMSLNRPVPIVDQAVFNFLLSLASYSNNTLFTDNSYAWAIQLGTTLGAVASGSGDLGKSAVADPEVMAKYMVTYIDKQPIIKNGLVLAVDETPFCVVHQADRLEASIYEDIKKRYETA